MLTEKVYGDIQGGTTVPGNTDLYQVSIHFPADNCPPLGVLGGSDNILRSNDSCPYDSGGRGQQYHGPVGNRNGTYCRHPSSVILS